MVFDEKESIIPEIEYGKNTIAVLEMLDFVRNKIKFDSDEHGVEIIRQDIKTLAACYRKVI